MLELELTFTGRLVFPRLTVHILRYGRVLCGAIHGAPGGWGPRGSMRWISYQDPLVREIRTCQTCREVLDALAVSKVAT